MAQSTLIPGSTRKVNIPQLQVINPAYLEFEKVLVDSLTNGGVQFVIDLCDELIFSLQSLLDVDQHETEYYQYQKYLHFAATGRDEEDFYFRALFLERVPSWIEMFKFQQNQLTTGKAWNIHFQRSFAEIIYFLRGGALFPQHWWLQPKIDFSDDFVEEMINLTEIWKKDFYSDNRYLPYVDEGFWGFREDEYTKILRLPDSDIELLEKAGFPNHKEGFAEHFPWEVKVWKMIVEEWKKGKWVVFLP